jgi:glycyl-tRNA synthetase
MDNLMEKIISLCKRRGFIYPGSEIYGGLSNSWDYGPYGVELKNNIKTEWWNRFVRRRDDMVGIDAALIMNPRVWEGSGHVKNFTDPLVECKQCHHRFRTDHLLVEGITSLDNIACPDCGEKGKFTDTKQFNLMFKTHIGPLEDPTSQAYFRPETAQAMFVDFKNVVETSRKTLPFGIAQIGKAFRNEITPGNFIFRTREFEQMEIEYFFAPPKTDEEWQTQFELWRQEMISWMRDILGLDMSKVHELEVPAEDRAHYSKRTIDFEYEFPFGVKELYGLAYRTDFDLKNHQEYSGQNLKYRDLITGEEFWPHVIEPTWGVDRTFLAVLVNGYREEGEGKQRRVYLKIKPSLAPVKVAVFPLVSNKEPIVEKARQVYTMIKANMTAAWDDRGNIGKRYYAQDEVGTPFCLTIDYDTLEDDAVTVRDRDTAKQERVGIGQLITYITEHIREG